MLLGAILLPFQLALLLVLHAVFAFSRFIALVRQLPQLWPPSRSPAPPVAEPSPEQLAQDRSRWKKTPGHLAVSFVPGQQLLGSWRRSKQTREAHELAKLVEGLRLLLGWCEQLGIAELSVYDEQGLLDRNASSVLKILARTRPILPKLEHKEGFSSFKMRSPRPTLIRNVELPGREVDSGCGISETEGVDSSAPTPARFRSNSDTSSATLKVNLLSRRAGRPRLARVGQALALAAQQGVYDREPLTTEMVVETIEASTFAEPDLLLILGGPYLRLHGFPPWEIRLTEMYHHPAPAWLPAPPISWTVLRRALDLYGGAQMRLGR